MAQSPVIFVAGYGWSGASALVDALKECKSANLPDVGEMRFLKSLREATRTIGQRSMHAQEYAKARTARGKYFRHAADLRKFQEWAEANGRIAGFESAADEVVSALCSSKLLPRRRRTDLRTSYVRAILFAVERASQFTICDNLVPASQLAILANVDSRSLPPVLIFVVKRKPQDMFLDQVEAGWLKGSASYWLFLIGHLRAQLASKVALARISFPVIEVGFEDLVFDQGTQAHIRDTVSEWLRKQGSFDDSWTLGSHFFPELSQKNVGRSQRGSAPSRGGIWGWWLG